MTTTTDGLGIDIGLGLPVVESAKPSHFGTLGLGLPAPTALRWPYSTRHASLTYGLRYDSSPTPSSSSSCSSSSDSEFGIAARRSSGSATHDVLSSYFSPTLPSGGEGAERKVYLLSSGLKNPKMGRSKSETFKFPLPPGKKVPLKSALRATSKTFSTSPVLSGVSGAGWRAQSWTTLSPQLEEDEVEARQGWSPYSSVAPTPRQPSGQQRFSTSHTAPALTEYSSGSSCSSQTLVSDGEDSGAETDPAFSTDAAKLARLHASLLLLDRGVEELPLSLGERKMQDLGGSVEEKMAYLCGLGYRYRRTGRHARKGSGDFANVREEQAVGGWWSDDDDQPARDEWKQGQVQSHAPTVGTAARVVSSSASAVTSSQCSPILTGLFAGTSAVEEQEESEEEGDETVRPHFLPKPAAFEALLGEEFAYLVDQDLIKTDEQSCTKPTYTAESGLMTPPLTTPELGLDGASPMFLDKWPSPLPASRKTLPTPVSPRPTAPLDGCKPFPARPSSITSSVSCPVSIDTLVVDDEVEIAHARRTTISPCSVLTRPRPLRSSTSNSSLFSSASSDRLQKPAGTQSVLTRPRPVPVRSDDGGLTFASKSDTVVASKRVGAAQAVRPAQVRKQLGFAMPKSASTTTMVKVPQRKSSLDVRAEALRRQAEDEPAVVHPNSISRDVDLQSKYHSSASPYLRPDAENRQICTSAASAAKTRRRLAPPEAKGGMSKSLSLPVLFTARTPSQRVRGESGHRRGRKSIVLAGYQGVEEQAETYRVEPPSEGVLVVSEQVTTIGLAL